MNDCCRLRISQLENLFLLLSLFFSFQGHPHCESHVTRMYLEEPPIDHTIQHQSNECQPQ